MVTFGDRSHALSLVRPILPASLTMSLLSPCVTHISKSVTCCTHFTHFSMSLIGPILLHTSLSLSLVAPILHTILSLIGPIVTIKF